MSSSRRLSWSLPNRVRYPSLCGPKAPSVYLYGSTVSPCQSFLFKFLIIQAMIHYYILGGGEVFKNIRFQPLPTLPPSQNPRFLPKSNHFSLVFICPDLSLCIYTCIIYSNIIGFGVCFLFFTQKISLYIFSCNFFFTQQHFGDLSVSVFLCVYIFLILLNCFQHSHDLITTAYFTIFY